MIRQLRRVRRGVRGVLALGVAASVAANILHARPNLISQAIAAWPPLALLITIELVAKVPAQTRKAVAARIAATVTIAGIAAWVSYWHMAGVAARYGEDLIAAHLLPLSVDGLIVVASVSLVELAQRIRIYEDVAQPERPAAQRAEGDAAAQPVFTPEPVVQPAADEAQSPPTSAQSRPAAQPQLREPRSAKRSAPQRRAKREAKHPVAQRHPLRDEVEARILAGETDLRALHASLNGEAPSLRSMQNWAAELREAQPAKVPGVDEG